MSEDFNKVIKHVFSNWTGLKLAVDHSMGGPNSKQLAIDCMAEVENFCLHEPNIDEYQIQDFLDDIMDDKFDTVFEDDSTKEIAAILYRFLQLLKAGDKTTYEFEYQQLPTANFEWLQDNRVHSQAHMNVEESSSEESDDETNTNTEIPMEEEGWTVVRTKKR